jgi:hypothetical protein
MTKRVGSVVALALSAVTVLAGRVEAQGALDGRTFVVMQSAPSGSSENGIADVLTFNGGMLDSLGCRLWGFTPGAYTAEEVTTEGGGTAFTATTTSPTEGSIAWSGTVYGDMAVGQATWHKEGQEDSGWTFQGSVATTALDGQTFALTSADPSGATDTDTLSFAGGMATSSGCTQYGFTPAPYSATPAAGTTPFMFATTSPTQGYMSWNGVISGDSVSGTFVWMKEGQAPIRYDFTGSPATP